jgi:uncharacterized membrane protein
MQGPTAFVAAATALLALAAGTAPAAHAGEIADAQVSSTLGIAGVKHKTKTATKYGMTYSDASYVDAAGQDLFTLRLGTPEQYAYWKQASATDAVAVPGVGIEAFRMKTFRAVCAKTAAAAACVTTSCWRC